MNKDAFGQARIRYVDRMIQRSHCEHMADGQYVRILILPNNEGLRGIGPTDAEAWWNLREAVNHWIDVQIENGRGVPRMRGVHAFEAAVKKLIAAHGVSTDETVVEVPAPVVPKRIEGWYLLAPPFGALEEPRFSQWDRIIRLRHRGRVRKNSCPEP